MPFKMSNQSGLMNLKRKVDTYNEVLANTEAYRAAWKDGLKEDIIDNLNMLIQETGLNATVSVRSEVANLDAIELSLGTAKSGLFKQVSEDLQRHLIKHSGSLIYQQLFNGKVIVLIHYPSIENYGQPRPPKTIAIYRVDELKAPFYVRHLEEFIQEITVWEDFDDDEPHQKIGFKLNFEDTATPG